MNEPILSLKGVSQIYTKRSAKGWRRVPVRAVDGVDLDIREGETLAIVGESGSGKSTLAKLLLMLNRPTQGQIAYRGLELDKLNHEWRSQYRRQVQAVFQDPSSSLNPRMTVEETLRHVANRHSLVTKLNQRDFLAAQLAAVGLNPPEQYFSRYPHQLSGGQQQRIAIARAIMLRPRVIIADEPLSSLDVSVQAQILQLMSDLRATTNVGFVIISHDLGAMQSIADRSAVMYRGRVVEIGDAIYQSPAHPYTRLLLDARLLPNPRGTRVRSPPPKQAAPFASVETTQGCRFLHRCPHAIEICAAIDPQLRPLGLGATQVACHRAEELSAATTPV
ncbi:oligopeptide/dipeptide ABC transporter ATP-binding protein [Microvirga arabica]|uniref:oligopeptide/dipeptide ABC transporter ATP-binding protein n=1 Tax=Microvirga arabica TaxID=1128671 RepID=UPI00193ADC31|nr:oligopeptide/dipeptide ABC transporter ATP-binding protein [Microvirga arabica]MBM1173418.1 ATP-binding cassette domain-containing protein [Microvirga arabica]